MDKFYLLVSGPEIFRKMKNWRKSQGLLLYHEKIYEGITGVLASIISGLQVIPRWGFWRILTKIGGVMKWWRNLHYSDEMVTKSVLSGRNFGENDTFFIFSYFGDCVEYTLYNLTYFIMKIVNGYWHYLTKKQRENFAHFLREW